MNAPSPSTTTAASKSSAERLSPNMDVERTPIPDQDRDRNGDSQYSNTNKENHHDGRNTHDDTPDSPSSNSGPSKRIRLRLACNQCRKRKVRCDAETPKCRNCWLRDEVCETTDPRYPEKGPSVRRWATKDGLLPGQRPGASHRNQTGGASRQGHEGLASATTPVTTPSDHGTGGASSDRTYDVRALRRGSVTSTSVSAATESPISHGIVDASPASGDGSVAAGTLSWVARGYQHSTIGGGGESSVTDSNADVVVNTDNSSHRFKYMGGSSLQCLGMFVDIYLRRKGLATMAPHFRNGMRHVEEFPLTLSITILPLPEPAPLKRYLDTFFSKIWPLYPVVDRSVIEAGIQKLYRLDNNCPNGLRQGLSSGHVPQLVAIYALVVLGADEMAGELTAVGETYLEAAYSLLAHLTAAPYLPSVQALFLLSLALRSRCKDGQGWHVLAQAIRTAHSIGLHRHIRLRSQQGDDSSEMPELGLKGRIWWSCYALEKLMELETGRPSAIDDDDIDQVPPSQGARRPPEEGPDFFALWVSLSRIFSQISKRLYRHRPNSAWRLMYEIGTLDQKLLEWAKTVPEGMKPGHELFTDLDSDQPQYPQHITSFLSLQYYQAQITLLRPSLVFPTQSFTDEVKRQGSKIPSYMRLLQAENICNASARATVRLVIELDDHGIRSNISSVSQPSLAAVVLSLSILKSPNKRLIRSDLELLTILTEYIETYFRRGGQDPAFIRGFEVLRTGVIAAVELERTGVTKAVGDMDMGLLDTQLTGPIPVTWETSSAVPEITADSSMFSFGEDMPLDELWGTFGTYSFLDPSVEEQVV